MLARTFAEHIRPGGAGPFPPLPEEALVAFVRRAQTAWPQVSVDPQRFVAFLARHLPRGVESPEDLAALEAHHLYLVCAYGMGVPAAQRIIESEYLPRASRALLRIGCTTEAAADIVQDLRCRLIGMQAPAVQVRGYSGRSDLARWLCLCAIRAAGMHRRRDRRERPLERAEEVVAGCADPEIESLRALFRDHFQAALGEALAALTGRERNLLRCHYVSRLSIDQIARLHDIHRATAARRLVRAEEHLVALTRARFLARVPMGTLSMAQLPALLMSRMRLDLRLLLRV